MTDSHKITPTGKQKESALAESLCKSKKYLVTFRQTYQVHVTAKDEQEARQLAQTKYDKRDREAGRCDCVAVEEAP